MNKNQGMKDFKCPSCHKLKSIEETPLLQQEEELRSRDRNFFENFLWEFTPANMNTYAYWACNQCLESTKAIRGNFEEQDFGMMGPYLAYVDKEVLCRTCEARFQFSASEQHHWYEELKFNTRSYPKDCLACRKKKQLKRAQNNTLMRLLEVYDKNSIKDLLEIAEAYEDAGLYLKAKEFSSRANNLEKNSNGEVNSKVHGTIVSHGKNR